MKSITNNHKILTKGCLTLLTLAQLSCRSMSDIVGRYAATYNTHLVSTFLELKKDSLFFVRSRGDVGGAFTNEGKWSLRKDTLVLSPVGVQEIVSVRSKNDPGSLNIRIFVKYEKDSTDIPISGLILNGKYIREKKGDAYSADPQLINELKVDYMNTQFAIPVDKITGNHISLFFDFTKSKMIYQIERRWLVRKGKLKGIENNLLFLKIKVAK